MFHNHVVIGVEAKEGAATSVNCAVNPELNTQQAFQQRHLGKLSDYLRRHSVDGVVSGSSW